MPNNTIQPIQLSPIFNGKIINDGYYRNAKEFIGANLTQGSQNIKIPLIDSKKQPNVIYTGLLNKENIQSSINDGSFFGKLRSAGGNFSRDENNNIPAGTVIANFNYCQDSFEAFVKLKSSQYVSQDAIQIGGMYLVAYEAKQIK